MLPWLVAMKRRQTERGRIFLVNLQNGWTVVAWFVAFIWAFGKEEHQKIEITVANKEEATILEKMLRNKN